MPPSSDDDFARRLAALRSKSYIAVSPLLSFPHISNHFFLPELPTTARARKTRSQRASQRSSRVRRAPPRQRPPTRRKRRRGTSARRTTSISPSWSTASSGRRGAGGTRSPPTTGPRSMRCLRRPRALPRRHRNGWSASGGRWREGRAGTGGSGI